jgi:predicted NUDIX family NTP pyrophosphohydrolase
MGQKKKSAGILLFRRKASQLEVFLVHPGGPFWARKDAGAWSIPKGEFEEGEEPREAAIREFQEETGIAPRGNFIELSPLKQSSGKTIYAWALEMDCTAAIKSNSFSLEWPKGSGRIESFPEIDRAAWFSVEEARTKLVQGQVPFLNQLLARLPQL